MAIPRVAAHRADNLQSSNHPLGHPMPSAPSGEKLVHKAKQHLDVAIRELDLEVIKFRDYGKGLAKQFKLSPDSFFQARVLRGVGERGVNPCQGPYLYHVSGKQGKFLVIKI
jgi:DNA-directed RNA polymerase subunit K/omega